MTTLREVHIRKKIRSSIEAKATALAKRVLFESLLNEDSEGVGSEFDKSEADALAVYNAAKASLQAWDDNRKKKDAYDGEMIRLRKGGMGEEKARKLLRTQDKYNFSVPLAAKRRETLETEVDKAEERYAAFNPEVRSYRRNKKGGARSTADKQLPPDDKKGILDINNVKFLTWHRWPVQVRKTKLQYGSKSAGEDGGQADSGVGPGEDWLAYVFGGQVQGGGVSYDIVMPDGSAWEVKQLLSKAETIRPGTEGRKAFEGAKRRLNGVMQQIKNFVTVADRVKLRDGLSPDQVKKLDFVQSFIEDDYEMIVGKGEISKERFIDLRSVLFTIKKLREDMNGPDVPDDPKNPTRTTVSLNDKVVNVSKPTFIDVAKKIEKDTGREDIMSDFEEFEIALATLKDSAFSDPRAFLNEWFNSIKIDNVFSQVDGVFIVNPRGFMIVPKSQLRSAMKFEKVTQMQPRFVLSIFGGGPSPE